MIKLLHLSDLHIHRHEHDNKAVKKTLKYVQDHYKDHVLIITGDITDDGHQEQYDNALKYLKPFKGRVFIAPGNHDFGAAGNFYTEDRARRFDSSLMAGLEQHGSFFGVNRPVVHVIKSETPKVMIITLDSNLETQHPFDFACGEIGETQLRGLEALLTDRSTFDYIKLLMLHHHPFIHNNPFMELKDARELWRTVYGRIDVMLFGHKHESWMWRNMNGVPYVLASDNSPGKAYARELTIDGVNLAVKDLKIG